MNEIHIKSDAKYIDIHHNDVVNVDISTKEPASEELEEVANNYADEHGFRVPYDGSDNFYDDVDVKASKEGFIAGANWQKQQMMKDAIEGYIYESIDSEHQWVESDFCEKPVGVEGQKVKLIVIKED